MTLLQKFASLFRPTPLISNNGLVLGLNTSSGEIISTNSALTEGTVYSCVRLISSNVASLPLMPFQVTEQGREKATDLKAYNLVTRSPNPAMTAMQWKWATAAQMLLFGNSYSKVDYGLDGQPIAFWLLNPADVQPFINDAGYPYYKYKGTTFDYKDILHFKNFSLDGLVGLSVIEMHRNKIGASLAANRYADSIYRNSAVVSGVLSHPGILSPEAKKKLEESWNSKYAGPSNSGKTVLLEEGLSFQPISLKPQDLEYIAQRKLSAVEICAVFGVPPHMVGASDNPTYASVEQMGTEFMNYTLRPYLIMMEQTLNKAFFSEDPQHYFQFNANAFYRTDIKSRYEAYKIGLNNGFMSVNEVRQLEELNQIEGGDQYYFPLNMGQVSVDPQKPEEGING